MESYAYLLLGLSLLAILAVLLLRRRDLVPKAIKLGIVGSLAGLAAESFYFRDYWRPPTTLGLAKFSPEDLIFGFAITALSVLAIPLFTHQHFAAGAEKARKKTFMLLFALGVTALLVFNLWQGLNSVLVSCVVFLVFSLIILALRPDLVGPAFYSALTVTTITLVIYAVLFDVMAPEFWDKYWLLADTKWGITILGNIPLTEMMWYFSWVLFASVSYPFASGTSLKENRSSKVKSG